jgi:hypothetical protein
MWKERIQETKERKLKVCIFQYPFNVHVQNVFLIYDLDHNYLRHML